MTHKTLCFLYRNLILIAMVAAASGCGATRDAQSTPTAARQRGAALARDLSALRDAEQTWASSLLKGDAVQLATIVAPEFSFIGPDGEYEEAAAYLDGYRALPRLGVRVASVDMDEVKTRVFGDTAIVTGRVVARVKVQGADVVENVRFTRVYGRHGQRWRMIAGQGTRIAPAGPSTAQAQAEP